ncbi:MAG: hypothetical protein ACTSPD_19185 [Promethearchaeota archaeon]
MLITYLMFLTTMLLLLLIIIVPLILISLIRKDKKLIFRRCKASCWALGFIILLLFPAFWLIPQQIYRRVNRQKELITPNAQEVNDFADDFLKEYSEFENMSFEDAAYAVSKFTLNRIKWKLDYETYGMSGHVATPSECIKKGADDCQGQAVTMASLLLNLGFKYVWVVETPFHWYVLVRDPDLGELSPGWEKKVEYYQESGDLIPLNRDGEGQMPEWRLERIILIFNNKETLYPVNFLEAIYISWTATGFFVDDFFPIFESFEIVFLITCMFALAIPLSLWTYYMSSIDDFKRKIDREQKFKKLFLRVVVLGPLLFLIFFTWYLLQPFIWDYTLIISILEISLLSVLASEPKFWKFLKIEK